MPPTDYTAGAVGRAAAAARRVERQYRFGPHELPCGAGALLVIALQRDTREWDAVYYQPRYAGDKIGRRFAITKPVLLDALRVLFGEADEPYDADAVIDYIRSTSWGLALPRLTAERKPAPMPQDERLAEEHGWSPDDDLEPAA